MPQQPTSPRAKAAQAGSGRVLPPASTSARARAAVPRQESGPPTSVRAKAATVGSTPMPTVTTVAGNVMLLSTDDALAILQAGHGPAHRVQAARSMMGVAYKQQTGFELRAGSSPAALEFMDCSEFVSRVLAIDGITHGVLPMTTKDLQKLLSQPSNFAHSSDQPQVGDVALWEGHVGIVSGVGKGNTIRLIHASGKGKLAGENKYAISPAKYRSGTFYGYYRPVHEGYASPGAAEPTPLKALGNLSNSRPQIKDFRSDADGTFPLREVFVRPGPGQTVPFSGTGPVPTTPQVNIPSPSGPPSPLPRH